MPLPLFGVVVCLTIDSQLACPGSTCSQLYVHMLWFSSGMRRVHMTFVTMVGLSLDDVTPPQSKSQDQCAWCQITVPWP
jgi:hypothetical protein